MHKGEAIEEGQDFNNWPCSDVTTTLQKLL